MNFRKFTGGLLAALACIGALVAPARADGWDLYGSEFIKTENTGNRAHANNDSGTITVGSGYSLTQVETPYRQTGTTYDDASTHVAVKSTLYIRFVENGSITVSSQAESWDYVRTVAYSGAQPNTHNGWGAFTWKGTRAWQTEFTTGGPTATAFALYSDCMSQDDNHYGNSGSGTTVDNSGEGFLFEPSMSTEDFSFTIYCGVVVGSFNLESIPWGGFSGYAGMTETVQIINQA